MTAIGVRRKGGIAVDSLPARRLAQLITQDRDHWRSIYRNALSTYIDSDEYVPQEDLLPIMTDPRHMTPAAASSDARHPACAPRASARALMATGAPEQSGHTTLPATRSASNRSWLIAIESIKDRPFTHAA
jgi:hypothetical protein